MKIATILPGAIPFLLLLKFGSCNPIIIPSNEDRHPKIFGILGVLTGVHLRRKFNLHAAQYNFFGSDWSALRLDVGHRVPSTTIYAEYHHHNGQPSGHEDHDHILLQSSHHRKYGRRLTNKIDLPKSHAQDLLLEDKKISHKILKNVQLKNTPGRLTRQATLLEEDSTDSDIGTTDQPTTINPDEPADTTSIPIAKPSGETSEQSPILPSSPSSTSIPIAEASGEASEQSPTLSSPPSNSYEPPPSGLPTTGLWSTYEPSYTPHSSYGPPTSLSTIDYGNSKTRNVHEISFTYPPISYYHDFSYSSPYSNNHVSALYPIFKPSYPDYYRNRWDPHGSYSFPKHFNGWH